MGVPGELAGRQVRCPHCKQVVTAPAAAAPPVAPPPVPVVAAPEPVPPPAPEPELRAFNLPQNKESADSILSDADESEDEVFGSKPAVRLTALPPPDAPVPPPTVEPVAPSDPFGFGPMTAPAAPEPKPAPNPLITETVFDLPPSVRPAPTPPAASPPPAGPANPFAEFEAPATRLPIPQPAPAPVPHPVAAKPVEPPAPTRPPRAGGENPFEDFDGAPAEPEPVPVLAPVAVKRAEAEEVNEVPDDEPPRKKKRRDEEPEADEKPSRAARARANESGGSGAKNIVLVLLIGYALVATGLAVYGLFIKSGDAVDTGHPLSTIPDNFGEFDPVSRKKVTQLKFRVDGELPADQRAELGGKVIIGQLEVQPKEVRQRPLAIEAEGEAERRTLRPGKALVLILDIKNTSNDLDIFPMDPAFSRQADSGATAANLPVTRLVVGKQVFAGGAIEWPLPKQFKKKIETQQANDAVPLKPGESREYVVFTDAKPDVVKAATTAREPLQWRVQVRRGLIDYKGKEVPVTAVIGVDFKASDIVGD